MFSVSANVVPSYGQGLVLAIYGFIVAGFARQIIKSNSQNKAYRPVMDAVFIVLVLGLTVLAFIVFVCQLVLCVVSPYVLTVLLIPLPPVQAIIAFQVIEMILALAIFVMCATLTAFQSCVKWEVARTSQA